MNEFMRSSDAFTWSMESDPRLRSTVPLTTFLADNGPVLLSWPQAFLFPCVHNLAVVSGGVV